MALLDLLGRRTTLRILWELRSGPLTFRALQEAAETNPGCLNSRIADLRTAGIVALADDGYLLTAEGRDLLNKLTPLSAWAERWARRMADN